MEFKKLQTFEDYLPNGITFENLISETDKNATYILDGGTAEKLFGDTLYTFDINDYPEVIKELKSYVPGYPGMNMQKNYVYVEDFKKENSKTQLSIEEALKELNKID